MKRKPASRTATHRPAKSPRRYRHDSLVAVDLFSGFGGLSRGIELAGFDVILAANHNEYKIKVHEANHQNTEHWIADLVDPESADYHDVRDLPAGDLLAAGVSCVNHSSANTQKAYEQGLTLFDFDDPEFEDRVTRSERDRATANCVLHYAQRHHPSLILVECTTEFTSWGPALQGRPKVGDGSTYRWWLKQFELLNYNHKTLYLNSMFFGVGQSRDRYYGAFWDKRIPAPDLEHRPFSWCDHCHQVVEAVWTWKTGVPATGVVRYGKQYNYTCPSCRKEVIPPSTPSLDILDLTNLGTRIGDRKNPLAPATMARAERCRQKFPDYPAILMPAKAVHGTERHPWQPLATQTSQQETALLSTAAILAAAGHTFEHPGSTCRTRDLSQPIWAQTSTNTIGMLAPPVALAGHVIPAHRHNGDGQPLGKPMDTVTTTPEKALLVAAIKNSQGTPRSVDTPLPTQTGTETLGLVSAGVIPFRKNTVPTGHGEAMPTVTSDQIPGLLTAAGTIKNHGDVDQAQYRTHPVSDPLGTVVASSANQSLLFSGWQEQDSQTTGGQLAAQWRETLARIPLEDCFFRMLGAHEIGRGCGFDTTYPDHEGTFQVWGTARQQVDGFGNAVSPPVGAWIGERLRASLHGSEA